jgi:frataxin-like iron-binding protein CyaY
MIHSQWNSFCFAFNSGCYDVDNNFMTIAAPNKKEIILNNQKEQLLL